MKEDKYFWIISIPIITLMILFVFLLVDSIDKESNSSLGLSPSELSNSIPDMKIFDEKRQKDFKFKESNVSAHIILTEKTLEEIINRQPVEQLFKNKKVTENVFLNGKIFQVGEFDAHFNRHNQLILTGNFKTENLKVRYKNWLGRTTAHLSDTNIRVKISIVPDITGKWRLKSKDTDVVVKSNGAQVKIAFLKIDVDGFLEEKLEKILKKELDKGYDLLPVIEKKWKELYKARAIKIKKEREVLWLATNPQKIYMSDIKIENKTLSIDIVIVAYLKIISSKEEETPLALPNLTTYTSSIDKKNILNIPIYLKLKDITKYLNKQSKLKNSDFIKIASFKVTNYNNKFKVIVNYNSVGDSIHKGKLILFGEPFYDKKFNQIVIRNLDYTIETEQFLNKFLDKVQMAFLKVKLKDDLEIELDFLSKYEKEYKREVKHGIVIDLNLDVLEVRDIYLNKKELIIDTYLEGNTTIRK